MFNSAEGLNEFKGGDSETCSAQNHMRAVSQFMI